MSTATGWSVREDGKPVILKDPDSSLRYWARLPLIEGDTVDIINAESEGVDVESEVLEEDGVAQFRVSGGTPGELGSVTLIWSTAGGDEDRRSLIFDVQQR